jgi:hypothetical protein
MTIVAIAVSKWSMSAKKKTTLLKAEADLREGSYWKTKPILKGGALEIDSNSYSLMSDNKSTLLSHTR